MGRFPVSHPNETRASTCGADFERIQGVTVRSTLVRTLRTLADFAEIQGKTPETADLRRAAEAIDALPQDEAASFVKRARRDRLTDEILFGELENGGTVTIDAADDKLTFAFQPRADEPQPHPAK